MIELNKTKICFVSAVNNETLYEECLSYIKSLIVPEGFEIEFFPIRNAPSIFNAYNEAIQSSDAKYKVYIHQDVFIINKNFINDILNIFNKDKNIGLIGVCGPKKLPPHGVWWESTENFGKVYENRTGQINLLQFQEILNEYQKVEIIDGLIIISQQDIKWRDDIFDSWHFYDISQSLEFKKLGYDIAIPKQITPWCIHYCGVVDTSDYEKSRQIFLNNYL